MKTKDRKLVTIAAVVAAVGGLVYLRKRQTTTTEASDNVVRYDAKDLKGIQVDLKAGDLLEIVTPGTATEPRWELTTDYPTEQIVLGSAENADGSFTWTWRVRAVIVQGGGDAPEGAWSFQVRDKDMLVGPPQPFTVKVHA